MERKSFIRSLLALAAAPQIIAELNIPAPAKPLPAGATVSLFRDLQLLTPKYYHDFMAKYGHESFVDVMNAMGKEQPMMPPPQMAEWKDGEMIIRDATPDEIGKTSDFHHT